MSYIPYSDMLFTNWLSFVFQYLKGRSTGIHNFKLTWL